MKLMHVADFHLDSAFSGFDKESADRKRAELRDCFARTMRLAATRGVSLVLIPGDLFDTPFCTAATRHAVFDAIRSAGCPVVIAPGNHDYYNKNGTYTDPALPENAYVFTSSELGRFDFDDIGVSVTGYAFTSDRYEENPLASPPPTVAGYINVLCAHADLGATFSKYAPISANAIARAGFSYAALGHIHTIKQPTVAGASLIAYSGFPQGRSFDELGEGGGYIIDIDPETKTASYERITLSSFSYETERLDVGGASDDADIVSKIDNLVCMRGYGRGTALRVILTGALPSPYTVNADAIRSSDGIPPLALLQIRDETSRALDTDGLREDVTVRGEVFRTLSPMLESENEEERARASLALKFALSALDRRELGID